MPQYMHYRQTNGQQTKLCVSMVNQKMT